MYKHTQITQFGEFKNKKRKNKKYTEYYREIPERKKSKRKRKRNCPVCGYHSMLFPFTNNLLFFPLKGIMVPPSGGIQKTHLPIPCVRIYYSISTFMWRCTSQICEIKGSSVRSAAKRIMRLSSIRLNNHAMCGIHIHKDASLSSPLLENYTHIRPSFSSSIHEKYSQRYAAGHTHAHMHTCIPFS